MYYFSSRNSKYRSFESSLPAQLISDSVTDMEAQALDSELTSPYNSLGIM